MLSIIWILSIIVFISCFVVGMIFEKKEKKHLYITLYSLSIGSIIVFFIVFGYDLVSKINSTELLDHEENSSEILLDGIKVGMSKEELFSFTNQQGVESPTFFQISKEQDGYIFSFSDGYVMVVLDTDRIKEIKVFYDAKSVEDYKKLLIELAKEEPKDSENEEDPDSHGGEPGEDVNTYTVKAGDTLWAISIKFNVSVDELKSWNGLTSDLIKVGQVLKVKGNSNDTENEEELEEPEKTEEPLDKPKDPTKIILKGNTSEKKIALTFDAGSDIAGIQILEILKKYNIKSTFFLTGAWVDKYPNYAKEIHTDGHEIANHSYSHENFTEVSESVRLESIRKTDEAIERVIGIKPAPYFRFPYGAYNRDALASVGKAGYPYSIHWSIDTIDWDQPSVEVIVERVLSRASNGDIILMHIGGKNTPAAMDIVIPELQSRGFKLVTISEILN